MAETYGGSCSNQFWQWHYQLHALRFPGRRQDRYEGDRFPDQSSRLGWSHLSIAASRQNALDYKRSIAQPWAIDREGKLFKINYFVKVDMGDLAKEQSAIGYHPRYQDCTIGPGVNFSIIATMTWCISREDKTVVSWTNCRAKFNRRLNQERDRWSAFFTGSALIHEQYYRVVYPDSSVSKPDSVDPSRMWILLCHGQPYHLDGSTLHLRLGGLCGRSISSQVKAIQKVDWSLTTSLPNSEGLVPDWEHFFRTVRAYLATGVPFSELFRAAHAPTWISAAHSRPGAHLSPYWPS